MLGSFLIAVSAGFADASVITYNTRAEFDSAISGQTMIDFEEQNTGGVNGYNDFGSSLTIGSVSFNQTESRLRVLGRDIFQTAGLPSSFLVNDGGLSNLVVEFTGEGVYSVAMDVGQIEEYYNPVGNMTLKFSSGDQISLTGLLQLSYTSNPLRFVGFTSHTAITSIVFDDPVGTTAIDNLAFSTSHIPEPASLVSLGVLVLLGLTFQPRSRRNAYFLE